MFLELYLREMKDQAAGAVGLGVLGGSDQQLPTSQYIYIATVSTDILVPTIGIINIPRYMSVLLSLITYSIHCVLFIDICTHIYTHTYVKHSPIVI